MGVFVAGVPSSLAPSPPSPAFLLPFPLPVYACYAGYMLNTPSFLITGLLACPPCSCSFFPSPNRPKFTRKGGRKKKHFFLSFISDVRSECNLTFLSHMLWPSKHANLFSGLANESNNVPERKTQRTIEFRG